MGATGKASSDSNSSTSLSSFEKAELRRLLDLGISGLSQVPVQGVLGYEQEYWRNPASVHVIRPEDITLNGYLNSVEALRGVPGMHVSRGLAYDNFASMRNFSGFSTQKFLGKIGGREVSQLMLGSANYSVDDYPVAVIDRIEVIRGPGASIWGTNAVNGVLNLVTKHSADTQGDSLRMAIQDNGTFMGDYVHGGQSFRGSYYRSGFEIRSMLRALLLPDYLLGMMATCERQDFGLINNWIVISTSMLLVDFPLVELEHDPGFVQPSII